MRTVLKMRLAPCAPLDLRIRNEDNTEEVKHFRLCWDANALTALEDKTGVRALEGGGLAIFAQFSSAKILAAALWAAALRNHPEYDTEDENHQSTDDGLIVMRSYLDADNAAAVESALVEAFLVSLSPERAKVLREAIDDFNEARESGKNPTGALAGAGAKEAVTQSSPGTSSGPSAASPESEAASSAG